uniref:Uncharacterized protein n=1 Tax=Aegilops tauschii TaxID=37682 RepID=M8C2F2_AEGTA
MELVSCIAMCLWFAFLLPSHVTATAPTGMVERETKQQILASLPPHWEENPVLFLTSPSGKYAAYFMRSQTAPGAGGLGADFCYVEVLDTTAPGAEGRSVWESECLALSTVNTPYDSGAPKHGCSLLGIGVALGVSSAIVMALGI